MTTWPRAAPEPQLAHNYQLATEFLRCLDPSASKFTFQFFNDPQHAQKFAKILHGSLQEVWPAILNLNSRHQLAGAFVTINETDLVGRKARHITRARALFVDADGPDQVHRCADFIASTGCIPSAIVNTRPGRAHYYWFCDDLQREDFTPLQRALAATLETDPAVSDLPRVMRLPGTYHLKDPADPQLVQLASVLKHTLEDLRYHLQERAQRRARPADPGFRPTSASYPGGNPVERLGVKVHWCIGKVRQPLSTR